MNLLDASWIPIRRRDGRQEHIAPWQITDQHDSNPVIAIYTARPDFDGALMQFFIGLLQTTTTIDDEIDWEYLLYNPPSTEQLREQLSAVANAFELDGDGPRFMQDLQLPEGETKEISALLIDAPGDNSLRNNLDLFIKRGRVAGMCKPCAAAALLTLQTNAPAGGAGNRTSLRGGGPLTTLVLCDPRRTGDDVGATLWHNVWLNVLEKTDFLSPCGNRNKRELSAMFPWLAPTRTSGKGGHDTTPDDVHPSQMFWGMPRRIRLDFDNLHSSVCDVCGVPSETLLTRYITKNYGINYTGPWLHPLTPHNMDKQGQPTPRHAQPGGVSYRHWLGLVQSDEGDVHKPARVVHTFQNRNRELHMSLMLWAFGYDMDNMKARCWYESQMPLYQIDEAHRQAFALTVKGMVEGADTVRFYLLSALKNSWFEPKDPRRKNDISFIAQAFWQNTEGQFFDCLGELAHNLQHEDDSLGTRNHIKAQWHQILYKQAFTLFDQWANTTAIAYENTRRIAEAYQQLRKSLFGPKLMRQILDLPRDTQRKGDMDDVATVS